MLLAPCHRARPHHVPGSPKSPITVVSLILSLIMGLGVSMIPVGGVQAQQLVATVNGDPITNYDVEQRIKLLKVLKRPAGREDAIEDLIADRIKTREMAKYQIGASNQEILSQGARDAMRAKLSPQALGAGITAARIDESHWKDHFRAEHMWNSYVAALNKTIEISESDIQAELAKRGKNTAVTEYTIRQVILIVPGNAPSGYEARLPEANGLRARFTDCNSGIALARAMNEVVVKEPITRDGTNLNDRLREILDHTEIGRLTAPDRTPNGLEMLALCQRKSVKDDQSGTAEVRNELLYNRLQGESDKMYQEMRSHALVIRR